MRDEMQPIVGNWYLDVEQDETFRVVAIDEEREIVEIQYTDGEADEIELDAWGDLDLDVGDPPEDESGEDDEGEAPASGWREKREAGGREPEEDEDDDWDEDEDDDEDDWDEDEEDDKYGSE